MKTKKLLSIIAALFLLSMTISAQSELFSRMPKDGQGKQIVSVHSFSAHTKTVEGAINMLIPDYANNEDKWCDNSSAQPWVIFELSNYYNVDKFVITDAQIREQSNGNVPEYKIYVTSEPYNELIAGWDEADWTEVYYGVNEGDSIIKTIQLAAPVEARFVKFHILDKGKRVNGDPENAIRIYGFDIYGSYSREVDRGNLISVGKTILKSEEGFNKRERAINILDGNVKNAYSKWCFGGFGQEKNQRYAVIDLEGMYDITDFKLFDADAVEANTQNLDGVDIYVSDVAPNLNVINMVDEDSNACWVKVVDSSMEVGLSVKDYTYGTALWAAPVTARFVKIEVPAYKAAGADPNGTSRIFQLEVYGTETVVPDNDATLGLLTLSESSLSPDFASHVTSYTVNVVKEIDSLFVSASSTHKGATVVGAGLKKLEIGNNVVEIKVTSKDKTVTNTYTITINRASQSKISTLSSLTASVGFFSPKFIADSTKYFVDVPFGTSEISLAGELSQVNAQVHGLGAQSLTGGSDEFLVTVTSEDGQASTIYSITVVPEEEGLISVNYGSPIGKRIVSIHSYSGKVNDTENPEKVLLGERLNTNGNTSNKWCDDSNANPWLILSLSDIYELNRIVIRDGKSVEAANSNVANVGSYWIGVSTTGTADEDFTVIAQDWPQDLNVIDIDYLQNEARYIKFKFDRGFKDSGDLAGAIWIYGIDIYGVKSQDIDRGGLLSVGKTIVSVSSHAGDRETPCNLIDGNVGYEQENIQTGEIEYKKHEPWAFNRNQGDGWVIIDLEETCSIDSFKLYDKEDWIKGYQVLVNNSGNDAAWEQVFNQTYEPVIEEYEDENWEIKERVVGPNPKVGILANAVNARFIKVFVPLEMQNGWNRIYEFEVYGNVVTGLNQLGSSAESMVVYPNPVAKGGELYLNEQGKLKIYSLQGAVLLERVVAGATSISIDVLSQGSYILSLTTDTGVKQAKLIVK